MVKSVMDHYCKAAYMGTISLEYDGVKEECPYTTPETLYVQKKLFDMARRGVKVVAMEASSHGLALKRIVVCAENKEIAKEKLIFSIDSLNKEMNIAGERYMLDEESIKKVHGFISAVDVILD